MKNYKINTNREPLSDADVAKGKDFNQLLKKYNAVKTPVFKTIKFWFSASALAAATITAIVLYNYRDGSHNLNSVPFINPPIAASNIQTTNYQVNTQRDSTITYTSGSKIHIPANAFLDSKGNAVKGNVDVHYREFKKVSEVFLSGIPMTYDSAGEQYHFESAGMMEISATQNGSYLKPNPNALIKVDMVSYNKENRFNTYYLDTVEKKWKYLAQTNYQPDAVMQVSSVSSDTAASELEGNRQNGQEVAQLKKIDRDISKLEVQKPVEPQKAEINKHRFTIKVDEKEFPEIAVYNHVKFEVDDKTYDPSKADVLWENIEMRRIDNLQNYEITFSKGNQQYKVVAVPVFDDKDYANAKKIYDEKYAEYQTKLTERKAEEARLKAEMEARQREAKKAMAEMEANRKQYEANFQQTDLVYRTFQVSYFGIWNCDCPNRLPQGASVIASLVNAKTGQPLAIQNLFLVEKGRNLMFSYNPYNLTNFRFDPNKENMVWAITNDGKVAVIKPEQFKEAKINGSQMQLDLTVIDQKFTSSEDAKKYLEI